MERYEKQAEGFTIPELIVTIAIAAMFALSAFQLSNAVSSLSGNGSMATKAGNIAYKNLRLYANGAKPYWFKCIGDVPGEASVEPKSDGKSYPNATGQILIETTSSSSINGLPAPVKQKVFAIAPYGCGDSAASMPIRIQSEVTYGNNPARTVTHATYASY